MIRYSLFLLGLFALFSTAVFSQGYSLLLQAGVRTPQENITAFLEKPDLSSSEQIDGRYFRTLQFYQIPSQELREEIEAQGVELISYLPKNAYFASLPANLDLSLLKNWGVRSVDQLRAVEKQHPSLVTGPYPDWALQGEKVKIILQYPKVLSAEGMNSLMAKLSLEVLDHYQPNGMIWTAIAPDQVRDLAAQPFVTYMELIPPPDELDNYLGTAMTRSNVLDSDYGAGRNYTGAGVGVAIGDDGIVGPHIDFEGRIIATNTTQNGSTDHADHVAGTILGAGNLNPKTKGAAAGADLHVFAFSTSLFNSYPSSYTIDNIRINSLSLSNGCNAGYTSVANQLDNQVRSYPGLMYVFSSGNEGGGQCGGVTGGWQTITGGHKSAKNVIAVANLAQTEIRNNSSSQGPATDGRIKPDVAALGTDVISTSGNNSYQTKTGTSMSCPAVSGLVSQLYEAYRDLNFTIDPEAGLLKAVLMNSSDDLGNPGPDFSYGWGRVNGRRAVETLENHTYLDSTINQSSVNTHILSIPANVAKAKIMLYWTDFEGAPNAAPALVNDLDFTITDPNSTVHNPWLLNAGPSPSPGSSAAPAIKGVDTLNNVEQIEIDNPMAGTYTLTINGTAVPQGPQKYFVVYEFQKDTIVVTYPQGGEGLVPGETERIRWDALSGGGNFNVEYSANNGGTWLNIASVSGSTKFTDWTVPSGITGEGRIRVTRGGLADISDAEFSIIPVPTNLRVTQVCQNYTRLEWDPVAGATSYDVFMLGTKYMDSVGTTSMTSYDVTQANFNNENWFSVRASVPTNQVRGRRAIAINQQPGLVNCAAQPPSAVFAAPASACQGMTVTMQDLSTNQPASWQWDISPATFTYLNGTNANSQSPDVVFTAFDIYTVTLITTNFAGSDTFSQIIDVSVGQPLAAFNPVPGGLEVIFVNNSLNGWFYTWDFGDGGLGTQQNPSHTYAQSGTYTAVLTVRNPCGTHNTSRTFTIVGTGLADLFSDARVALFPNPSQDKFHFELEGGPSGNMAFKVMNVHGQVVQQFDRQSVDGSLRETLDLSHLSPGIYLLRVQHEDQIGTLKLFLR